MNSNPHPNRQGLRDQPDSVDKVLNALNSAEPPTGMEQRILHAVELRMAAESNAQAPHSRLRRVRSMRIAPYFAFAAALALLVLGLVRLFQAHPTAAPLPQVAKSEKAAPFTGPTLHMDPAAARAMDPMPTPVLASTALPLPVPHPPHGAAKPDFFLVTASATPRATATTPTAKPLVSFPAPPMPITEQEQLLLRIAHRNDPESVEALDAEKRAVREAKDNSEFENFFPAPEPVVYPALLVSQVSQPVAPHK